MTNNGKETLALIEVQCGDYLGEDDIVRLEDNYGRVALTTDVVTHQAAAQMPISLHS